jgi:hypothetical protein
MSISGLRPYTRFPSVAEARLERRAGLSIDHLGLMAVAGLRCRLPIFS